MYITTVMPTLPAYMPTVLPINTTRHSCDSSSSIFSMQNSANVCARSTSSTSPNSKNSTAPMSAT